MKNKHTLYHYLLLFILPAILLAGCETKQQHTGEEVASEQLTYTCPMHPQIVSLQPSTCPICAMSLVVFDRNNQDPFLTLGPEQILLANIQTTLIGGEGMNATRVLNGRLTVNEEAIEYISSRYPGRIENLYIRETGVQVKKGQALFSIYSEEIAALQQELLIAAAQFKAFPGNKTFEEIYTSAKQKLELYGIHKSQINAIETEGKINPVITVYATKGGMIADLLVTEGQYINEGMEVVRIENYEKLWVEAEVYPNEAAMIQKNMLVKAKFPSTGDSLYTVKIEFVSPELISGTQLGSIRGSVSNKNGWLTPGSQASIIIYAEDNIGSLSIPTNAIINEEKGSHVWIEFEEGKFEPRIVTTGITGGNMAEITSGIEAGDKLVINGAYLLYSEFILKKGAHPVTY